MSIQQLRYVVTALELSSHAKAAERLFVSPQSISKAVAEAEKHYGHKLFEREGRGVRPTPFGDEIARRGRAIIRQYDDLGSLEPSALDDEKPSGRIAIALSTAPYRGSIVARKSLSQFSARFPLVELDIIPFTNNDCYCALREETVDAAIVLGEPHSEHLCGSRIGVLPLTIIAHKRNDIARRDSVEFAQLSHTPVAYPDDLRCTFPAIKSQFQQLGIPMPDFRHIPSHEKDLYTFISTGGVVLSGPENPLLSSHADLVNVPFKDRFALPIYIIRRIGNLTPALHALESYLAITHRGKTVSRAPTPVS